MTNDRYTDHFWTLEKHDDNTYSFLGKTYQEKPARFLVLSLGKYNLLGFAMLLLSYLIENGVVLSHYEASSPVHYNILMGFLIFGGFILIVSAGWAYSKI